MAGLLRKALKVSALWGYGLFTLFAYAMVSMMNGSFFRQTTEKEKLELQLGAYLSLEVRSTRWAFILIRVCPSPRSLLEPGIPVFRLLPSLPDPP